MEREVRAGIPCEVRADADSVKVEGYAAIFGETANIGGLWDEVIHPGSFRNALTRDKVSFLIEHRGLPLADTVTGTLTLSEDSKGLKISADLDPSDPDVKRVVPKMRRGLLSKMSFGFRADKDGGQDWDYSKEMPMRNLRSVELLDVSVVSNPAYEGTEIALRSLEASRPAMSATEFRARQKARLIR